MEENKNTAATNAIIDAAAHHLTAAGNLNRSVRNARRAGLSWTEIGEALGTTKQAAQQRFGKTADVSTIVFKEAQA